MASEQLLKIFLVVQGILGLCHCFPARTRRWCCISADEYSKCERLSSNYGDAFPFACVFGQDVTDCVVKIRNDDADFISLDGGDIYTHGDGLKVAAAEYYGNEFAGTSYFAVAVVKNIDGAPQSLNDLRAKLEQDGELRSCHTGVGKSSGWIAPMGRLAQLNLDPYNLFTESCAPGAKDTNYQRFMRSANSERKDEWCALCHGDGENRNKCARTHDEEYYGYHGALKCLDETSADVAFIKHSIIDEKDYDNYWILCGDGETRKSPGEWQECNLGKVPAHAVMMSDKQDDAVAAEVISILNNAKAVIGDHDFLGRSSLLWKSKVKSFSPSEHSDPLGYLGDAYVCSYAYVSGDPNKPDYCRN